MTVDFVVEFVYGGQVWNQESHGRGLDLLARFLSRMQFKQFKATGEFPVRGSRGGRYVIHADFAYNVERVSRFGSRQFYCARPDRNLPLGDVLLAQKLALETDEAAFLRIANPRCEEAFLRIVNPR